MQSFATYFVGFAARPIGAAIFGHWGDRIGRKTTLIITLLVMGLASAVIGIMPGTATIGVAAPLLLVILRVLQGIAVGGEWSGSVLLTMEWGDQKRRGLLGSFAQIGVPVGLVLGTGGMTLLSATMSEDAFDSWGWRIPFLASLILVAVGLVIRLRILETPMFAKVLEQGKTASAPVKDAIKHHWREILLSAGVRFAEQMPFYLFTTFVLTYVVQSPPLQQDLHPLGGPGRCHRRTRGDPVLLTPVGLAGQEKGVHGRCGERRAVRVPILLRADARQRCARYSS